MRHVRLASSILLFALAISPALAQQPKGGGGEGVPPPAAKPGPYKAVAVTLPKPLGDASFDQFRAKLADVVKKKDRAALATLIVAKGFFWQRGDGKATDAKKPAIDTLAAAIGLDEKDGAGWEILAGYAAEPTAAPAPDMKGVLCAPALATFNDKDFEAIIKSTNTDPGEWAYPSSAGLEMREKGDAGAPVVEKLGLTLVRVLSDDAASTGEWTRIVAPSGKTGFVQLTALSPLFAEQLCYLKDGAGWHIAGYAGGGGDQ
jgi:hypothetical protein